MECPSYKPKTKMNRLIPAHPFPTGENTSVDFLDEPMEKETEIDDYRHQNKADEFQEAYKKVVSEYDDERGMTMFVNSYSYNIYTKIRKIIE